MITSTIHRSDNLERAIINTLQNSGSFYWAGCGGCASIADHAAAELMGRLDIDRDPIRSFSLSSNSSLITCIANDYSFTDAFARQVKTLTPNDLLFLLSTSGESASLVRAIKTAKELNIPAVAITKQDSKLGAYSLYPPGSLITFRSTNPNKYANTAAKIQEWMISEIHNLCKQIQTEFLHQKSLSQTPKEEQIVFTNGVFNILHAGHLWLLNEAKSFGDKLIVAIDTTEKAQQDKPNTYILPVNLRFNNLNALGFIDHIYQFSTDKELEKLIYNIHPSILIKGPDYDNKTIVGENYTNEVLILTDSPYTYSSSDIIKSIQNNI